MFTRNAVLTVVCNRLLNLSIAYNLNSPKSGMISSAL